MKLNDSLFLREAFNFGTFIAEAGTCISDKNQK